MPSDDNKDIIRRVHAALERGDRRVFAAYLHPDCVWRITGHSSWSRRFEGVEAIRRDLLGPLFALFATPYTSRAIHLVAEGDVVVAEASGDVRTHRGDRYDNAYCFVYHLREGRIVEVVEYSDTALGERVLGPYEEALAAVARRR